MTGRPIRYILKYITARGRTSSGTLRELSILPTKNSAITATIVPPTSANIIEVCTARWTDSLLFLPMAFAITTFAPSEMPIRKFTISPITGPFAPTAATAAVLLSPAKLPTTARSDALKSCSSIAVAATGSANSGSLFQIEPLSISIFFAPERFISFPAFFERFHVLEKC